MTDLPFHPIADCFPLMTGPEFDELVNSVRKRLRHPIVTWTDPDGKRWIIDGRNRYRACEKAGVEPQFVEWDGEGSLVSYIVDVNLPRRHLTTAERAMLAIDLKPHLEAEAKQRMHAGKTLGKIFSRVGKASDLAGEMVGVSGKSVQQAAKVKEKGSQELKDAVRAGEVPLYKAADIAELPPEEQARVINAAEDGADLGRKQEDLRTLLERAMARQRRTVRDLEEAGEVVSGIQRQEIDEARWAEVKNMELVGKLLDSMTVAA